MNSTQSQSLTAMATEAAKLLHRIANPDRLLVLCMLVEGEKNVGELGELTGIKQPTLSQQLTVLRTEQLVQTRRSGKYIYYRLEHPDVLQIMQTLYDIFCASQEKEHDD